MTIDIDDASFPIGLVCVHGVRFEKGWSEATLGEGYFGGGALLVKESHRTVLSNCWFQSNATTHEALDDIVVEDFLDEHLPAGDVRDKILDNFDTIADYMDLPTTRQNDAHLAQGCGGAVSLISSSAYCRQNLFEDNWSSDRGGALCNTGYGWPVVLGNLFVNNWAVPTETGRGDGGSFAAFVAVPSNAGWDLREEDLLATFVEFLSTKSVSELSDYTDWTEIKWSVVLPDAIEYAGWFDLDAVEEAKKRYLVLEG